MGIGVQTVMRTRCRTWPCRDFQIRTSNSASGLHGLTLTTNGCYSVFPVFTSAERSVVVKSCSIVQFMEQRLGVLQVGGIEALGEPFIDGSEKILSSCALPPLSQHSCETHRRPQLPGLCSLLTRKRDRLVEISSASSVCCWRNRNSPRIRRVSGSTYSSSGLACKALPTVSSA